MGWYLLWYRCGAKVGFGRGQLLGKSRKKKLDRRAGYTGYNTGEYYETNTQDTALIKKRALIIIAHIKYIARKRQVSKFRGKAAALASAARCKKVKEKTLRHYLDVKMPSGRKKKL